MHRCSREGLSPFDNTKVRQLELLGVDPDPLVNLLRVKMLAQEMDAVQIERIRFKQKIQLGRYARQSVLQWDDVSLSDFLLYYDLMTEVVSSENTTIPTED